MNKYTKEFLNIFKNCFVNSVIVKSKYNDIKCKVPSSTTFKHYGIGVIIAKDVVLGRCCVINQNVTIGQKNNGVPSIGDNVRIYSNAVVIGGIRVGNNVIIGAGAVVLHDVPDGCTVVGNPACIVKEGFADGRL